LSVSRAKKLEPSPERLLAVLHRWRDEAVKADRSITRIALAFEAGRDGFWLARWLAARGVEAHVIHPSSVAVSREHRRAKTDRLDTELLKRGFLGWLRGERGHCSMVRVPTLAEEDAKRPNRERECLVKERTRLVNRMKGTRDRLGIRNFRPTLRKAAEHLAALYTPEGSPLPPNVSAELERDIARLGVVIGQIKQIEAARRQRLEEEPERGRHAMIRQLARVAGIGIETADMLVNELLSRPLRDRRAAGKKTASASYHGQWRGTVVVYTEVNSCRRARVQDNTTSWISRSPTFVSSRTLRRVYAMSAAVTGFVGLPASSWRASNIARSSESVSRL
jgi:transposase